VPAWTLVVLGLTAATMTLTCQRADVSEAPGPPGIETNDYVQAETAIVTARTGKLADPMAKPLLVTTYNDGSNGVVQTRSGAQAEFVFGPGLTKQQLFARSGASFLGWATSTDGEKWQYRGKIRPQRPKPAQGEEGWALVTFDPTIGLDETDPDFLYVVQLGVSQATFHEYTFTNSDGLGEVGALPADGFCVARSRDGGKTLGREIDFATGTATEPGFASCHRVTDKFDPFLHDKPHIDKTAATVDWLGRLWVAIEDRGSQSTFNRIRVFHNVDARDGWDTFVEVPACSGSTVGVECIPAEGLGLVEPVLRSTLRCSRDFVECAAVSAGYGGVYLVSTANPDDPLTVELRVAILQTPILDGAQCDSDAECGSGSCDEASHLCECAQTAQCPAELSCQSGRCKAIPCASSSQCPTGMVCNPDLGTCAQLPEWSGGSLSAICTTLSTPLLLASGNPDMEIGLTTEKINLRGAFRYSYDIGRDPDGLEVLRLAYRTAPTGVPHIQMLRLGGDPASPDGFSCRQSPFQNTALLGLASPNLGPLPGEFQPVVDWHDRSAPPGFGSQYEWQLGFLGPTFSVDRTQRYLHATAMTLWRRTIGGVAVDTLEAPVPLHGLNESSTHYACPDQRGYWGDYFGITQFRREGYGLSLGFLGAVQDPWLNASTFSVSSFKLATTPSSCATATKVYSAPVDVEAYTWPSLTYALPPN
jgi:hypothetical protein